MREKLVVIPVCLLAVLLFVNFGVAGTTGKISGQVIDKDSGAGLPGVNVIIRGTSLGAATDMNGYYTVINLPPGSYAVSVTMIGYSEVTIEAVKIQVDRTTTQNVSLVPETIKGEEVVVIAERPLVERDRTNSAAYVDAETIQLLPVQDISDVVELQAGVVAGADGSLHVRGGRAREISYMIDGVNVTNSFSQDGGSNVAVENAFIEELQVITGTFNAEYGSAQSGVINVVTKRPQRQFHGQAEFFAGDYVSSNTDRFIGISDFNPTGELDIQATLTGPIFKDKLGFFASVRNYRRDGHLFGERRYNAQDGWIIDAYRHWYTERFASQVTGEGRIAIPDSLTTGDRATVPMARSEKLTFTGKLTFSPVAALGLNYSIFVADAQSQGYNDAWRYAPDGRSSGYGNSHHHFLSFRHSASNTLFYNLRASYQYNNSESYLYDNLDISDFPGDPGYLPLGASDDQTGFIQGDNQRGRGYQIRKLYMANGDLNWQLDRHNFVKLGFEYRKHDIRNHSEPLVETTDWQSTKYTTAISGKGLEFDEYLTAMTEYWKNWSAQTGGPKLRPANTTDGDYVDYSRNPVELAAYLQDKVELGELVINAGLRFDVFDARAQTLRNKRALSGELGNDENLKSTTVKTQLSPRLGLSFPISVNGAFHVSYGHFFQMPSFELLFQRPVDEQLTPLLLEGATLGDPDLKPERTISYEVGLQQQLTDGWALDLTLFYKDIRDQLGVEAVRTPDVVGYSRYINRDYGNVKGLTLATRLRSGMVSGTVDYTYQNARGSASDPNFLQLIEVATRLSGEPIQFPERQILPLDWDQTHTINLTLNFVQPRNWAVSFIGTWGSGLPYSPSSVEQLQLPDREFKNSARKPVRHNLDVKASKEFRIAGMSYSIFMRIYNLFDHLNENSVYSVTGRATTNARLPVDEQVQSRFLQQGGQFTMTEWDNRPGWFSEPRRLQLGLSIGF